MIPPLTLMPDPELIIGLVAPIGVNMDIVSEATSKALTALKYEVSEFRLTRLMRDIDVGLEIAEGPFVKSYKDRIAYANKVRLNLGDDALAALAITAIRKFRSDTNSVKDADAPPNDRDEYRSLTRIAYLLRQFKRPEEIVLLRRVYGKQFILISAYAPPATRKRVITEKERQSTNSQTSAWAAENAANELIALDSKEALDQHGQNVRDVFPLADVIVDATTQETCEKDLTRFIRLLFGNNKITPTKREYGMYAAKSASLRSADLSRQVGAAIFRTTGEIVTMGSNEVPRFGGGTYWTGDVDDARDYSRGYDPNDRRQFEILVDLISRLYQRGHLSTRLSEYADPAQIAKFLISEIGDNIVSNSMIMDLLEFGRIIHAEMSAISDAARRGISTEGATLFCTTFPCHMCAKHIVSSGIKSVVYLEPYQKSYAYELHRDSIVVDGDDPKKVSFQTFTGVSPVRYRDIFERRTKRKDKSGDFVEWCDGEPRPNIELYYPGYREAEERVAADFDERLTTFRKGQSITDPTSQSPDANEA